MIKKTSIIATAMIGATLSGAVSSQGNEGPRLEEVIVTAQKRTVSMQDVPVSVAAITEDDIIKGAITNFEDYARGIAGLSFSQAGRFSRGGNVPTIRGISQIGIHPVSAFMIDEAPLQPQEFERVGIPDPNMFDIARVEILRGPQGDIYGSSAMGGVVRVITNKPDPERLEGRVAMDLSTIKEGSESYELSGMLNIPLADDRAALRIVAQQSHDGGYVDLVPFKQIDEFRNGTGIVNLDKDANSADVSMFRAALLWDATDNLRITPSVFYQNIEEDRGRYVATQLSMETGELVDIDYGINEFANNEFLNSNLLVEWDLGIGQLISSTTYFQLEWANSLGSQGIPCNFFRTCGDGTASLNDFGDEEQIIQELRFASELDGPINFIAGVFYRDVKHTFDQFGTADSLIPILGNNLIFEKENEVEKVEEYAVFGQVTWEFIENFELALGGRWYHYQRDRFTPDTFGAFGFPQRSTGAEESGALPTVSLRYTPNDDMMLYSRYAEGFRPGFGFATVFPDLCDAELSRLGIDADSGVGQVDPDSIETWELGAKTALLDNRVTVNGAIYRTDWQDIHTRVGLNCGFSLDQNAGTAEINGAELEVKAVFGGLDLSMSLGYTDAKFTESVPAIGALNGNPLPEVPEWIFGLVAQYGFQALGGNAYVRGDYSYTDEALLKVARTSPLDAVDKPSIELFGARFGVDYEDWSFAIYSKNLLDESAFDLCPREITFRNARPETSSCVLEPRQIGVYFSKNFN